MFLQKKIILDEFEYSIKLYSRQNEKISHACASHQMHRIDTLSRARDRAACGWGGEAVGVVEFGVDGGHVEGPPDGHHLDEPVHDVQRLGKEGGGGAGASRPGANPPPEVQRLGDGGGGRGLGRRPPKPRCQPNRPKGTNVKTAGDFPFEFCNQEG